MQTPSIGNCQKVISPKEKNALWYFKVRHLRRRFDAHATFKNIQVYEKSSTGPCPLPLHVSVIVGGDLAEPVA